MIYEEHGLTTEIAFNSALKKAGIEITSYIAPKEITTDVICTVDTTRHDEEIRADEKAKTIEEFAEMMRGLNMLKCFANYIHGKIDLEELMHYASEEIAKQMKGGAE